MKNSLDVLFAKMFPKAFVSASPAGLYLKRQPWNFLHPPILIPWSRVSSVRTVSATEHVTGAVGRQMEFRGLPLRANIPGAIGGVINALAGEVVEVRLSDPNLRLQLPADAAGDLEQYQAAKPATPAQRPTSLVGAR